MSPIYEVLPNGTEVLLAEDHRSRTVALQIWVKVGAGHETSAQTGMAHFIEHMLFKGTETRKVGEICQTVEACGGTINAYTHYDRTVYHLTLSTEYTDLGLELLHDAIYNSVLDPNEIAKEKEVICEEINEYEDDPASKVREEMLRLAFQGEVKPILGNSPEAVRAFTPADLNVFYRTHYVPANLAVVAVGSFSSAHVLNKITSLFSTKCDIDSTPPTRVPLSYPQFVPRVQSKIICGDYHTPRLLLGFPAPTQGDVDALSFELAAFVLGSGDASRLNLQLRDRARLVSALAIACTNMKNWGMLEIGALTSHEKIPAAVTGIVKYLQSFIHTNPPIATELARARVNAKVDLVHQNETVDGLAENIGFGLITPQKYLYSEYYMALLAEISPAAVQQTLQRHLCLDRAVIICALPPDTGITAEQLTASYKQGLTSPPAGARSLLRNTLCRFLAPSPPQTKLGHQGTLHKLTNGIDFIYKRHPQSQLCNLVAVTRGGLAAEQPATNGTYNAVANMLGQATQFHNHDRLTLEIENRGALLSGFSGKDSFGIQLQCLREDIAHFSAILGQCLTHPVFPEMQWQTVAAEIRDAIDMREENPASLCMQKFREKFFAGHPYHMPMNGTDISTFTPHTVGESFRTYRDQGAWVIAALSDLAEDKMLALVEKNLAVFHPPLHHQSIPPTAPLTSSASYFYPKAREQCHLIVGFAGLTWHDPDRIALDVLLNILGSSGSRLFRTLREEQGLVYTVSPILSYGLWGGTFGIYTSCSPAKEEQALAMINAELQMQTPPQDEEIDRAKKYILGSYDLEMARGDKQVTHMALMHLFGVGYIDDYPDKVKAVTAADIDRVISRLLVDRPRLRVKVGPHE